ncbi:Mov34/MPN/PAD-1 family protein [Rhizobium rhizogenes]|jgi:proteasome lid subunit RPN8/RPN11|uniref:Mov34/MPN/PAD-1 family protein n=1 Tax=Rhizobium rhizogenes TaxID=359 RepID=UPI0015735D47|nr:Mov34/MPN/PAD-1 family protein [Rhizobium rhizogenes]NTF49067.1 hypothetical protein [Rhizobium rhizogenes]NTH06451.1 hypothetical protein [Rhizobium rhizogenes]NTH51585.1 hypothetical protein [Rhizobium rhizogenes]NTH71169.1 hypothetical protein [Rhizobium rhizogenes]
MLDDDHHFTSTDLRFHVVVREEVARFIVDSAIKAKNNETGGILIGHIDDNGRATIAEATSKPRGSKFTWRTFVRAPTGLMALLKSRWEEKQYYLGEWHSHPGSSPEPSGQDRSSMVAIAADLKYNCKEPILIIVGTKASGTKLSVTVFPRRERDVRLSAADNRFSKWVSPKLKSPGP